MLKKISKQETFKNSEKIGNSFEKLPIFLHEKLGENFECPNCHNKMNFQIFYESELISTNVVFDYYNKIWRIESPNLGPLKIKDIKCLNCHIKIRKEDYGK